MDVPSRHSVDVQPGPAEGLSATVYVVDLGLPARLHQDLCEAVERQLHDLAEPIEARRCKQRVLVAFRFLPGVNMGEALRVVRQAKAWFFESLVSASDQRAEARARKARAKEIRRLHRRERHQARQSCLAFKGAPAHKR